MKIFVCIPLTEMQQQSLVHSLKGDDMFFVPENGSGPEVKAAFNASEVVFGNPPADWLLDGSQPRWIQLESVGFGEYLHAGLAAGPNLPMMSNLSGFFSEPVAESLLAGILGTAGRSRVWPVIFGVISIAAGAVVVSMPLHSTKVLAILLGVWFLVMGVLMILGGLFIRSDLKKADVIEA